MHCCCVKYCRNKLSNARLFRFLKVNCRFTAELQDISRKRRIAQFRAIKFKNTKMFQVFLLTIAEFVRAIPSQVSDLRQPWFSTKHCTLY